MTRRKGSSGKSARPARRRKPAVRRPTRPTRPSRTPRSAPAARDKELRARDLMTRTPVTVPTEMRVGALCDLLQERNINGAPVVDESGRLVGVVTQEDIIYGAMGHPSPVPGDPQAAGTLEGGANSVPARKAGRSSKRMVAMLRGGHLHEAPPAPLRRGEKPFWAELRSPDPMEMPVSTIMTSPAISAEEDTLVMELCRLMWSLRIHRVPILKKGKVTGLVSSMDLCRAVLEGKIRI